jgi:hypothetical protein
MEGHIVSSIVVPESIIAWGGIWVRHLGKPDGTCDGGRWYVSSIWSNWEDHLVRSSETIPNSMKTLSSSAAVKTLWSHSLADRKPCYQLEIRWLLMKWWLCVGPISIYWPNYFYTCLKQNLFLSSVTNNPNKRTICINYIVYNVGQD